jgi:hypothetical protein
MNRDFSRTDSATESAAGSTEPGLAGRPSARRWLAAILLLAGMGATYWLIKPKGLAALGTFTQLIAIAAIALLACVPVLNRGFLHLLDRVRLPSPRARAITAVVIGVIALIYLIGTAEGQHRDLFPRLHDECSYMLQARMMADGRLWLPQHQLADFFETFHVLTKPVYASIYFPGTALFNVFGVWFAQPSWVVPILLAAMVVATSYLVTAELIDGLAGILVALMVVATWMFRVYSTMVMAQVPVMLLGLLLWWAWIRWRREHAAGWAILVGAFAGWAAITRPVDALAFALPVGLAMLWELRRKPSRMIGRTAGLVVAGALPFLCLQAALDWGTTGNPWKTPYVSYLEQNQPGAVFGSRPSEFSHPQSTLPQKQIYFREFATTVQRNRSAGMLAWLGLRTRMTAMAALPFAPALLLLPASLLLLRERLRWVPLASIPLWYALYAMNPFFLLHYALPLAAVVSLAAVLGARGIEQAIRWEAGRRAARAFFPAALACLAITSLPEFNHRVTDKMYGMPFLDHVERTLARIRPPAVVFFHFEPGCNVHEEPVYNIQAANPDDQPIIRAQDLGPRDGELLRYYAARQPERLYYIMDRRNGRMFSLGNAAQAAAAMHVPLNLPASAPPGGGR